MTTKRFREKSEVTKKRKTARWEGKMKEKREMHANHIRQRGGSITREERMGKIFEVKEAT